MEAGSAVNTNVKDGQVPRFEILPSNLGAQFPHLFVPSSRLILTQK